MRNLLFLLLISSNVTTFAQAPDLAWAKSFGESNFDQNAYSVKTDNNGNVIIVGKFIGTVDFDPSVNTSNLTSTPGGFPDIFIAKYDQAANLIWAKQIGNPYDEDIAGLVVDGSNNIYLAGTFQGTVGFDLGNNTANLTSNGGYDVFFAKYTTSGNYVFAKNFGSNSTTYHDYCQLLTYDSYRDDIVIAGFFYGTVDFDPDAGNKNVSSFSGNQDIYIARYRCSNGSIVFATNWGSGISGFAPSAICIDNNGNTLIAATNQGTPLKKISPTGDHMPWTNTPTFSSTLRTRVTSIQVSANGDIYFGYNTKNFGNSPGETGIYKFNSSGNLWHIGFIPGVIDDYNVRVILNETDSVVYLAGNYSGTIDITGSGAYEVGGSVFLAKYDLNGNYGWSETITTGSAILNDATLYNHSIFTCGNFQNTSDFDPTSNTYNLNSAGQKDAYLAKYGNSANTCSANFTIYPDSNIPHNWFAVNQATGSGSLTYTWYWGDGTNSTGATLSHTYSTAGYYNICLSIVDSTGCTDTYCDSSTYIFKTESMITVNVVSQLPTAIPEAQANAIVSIHPNPATNQLFIETNGTPVTEINIYNTTGSLVSSVRAIHESPQQVDISNLATGVYIVEIKTKDGSIKRRWIKM